MGRENKKGASSLEFVLAFVLFAGVVVSIFFFFSPIKNTGLMSNSLTYTYNQIEKDTQIELEEYSVVITSQAEIVRVTLPNIPESRNARVESYYGEVFASKKDGNDISFRRANSRGEKENFAVIKLSKDFAPGTLAAGGAAGGYQISSSSSRKVISEKEFERLKAEYDGGYAELKDRLKISTDFSFSLILSNKAISASKASLSKKEAFADSQTVEVLRLSDGTIEFAKLNIKIW